MRGVSLGSVGHDAGGTDADALSQPAGAVGDSLIVAGFTIVSRVTGVLRVVAIAAVLGPTYFGNTFQASNSLPNTVYYGLLGGTLLSSILVPALVHHIDGRDDDAVERVVGGFLGVILVALVVVTPIAWLGLPSLLGASSSGAGEDGGAAQAHASRLLLVLLLPQVLLYAVIGSSTAVMHARRRFALAAAAPALENLGTILTVGAAAVLFDAPARRAGIAPQEILLLGTGSTAAVAVHAVVQWLGARRLGVAIRPRRGWRDAEVRALVGKARPGLAYAALGGAQVLAVVVVANRVAGGVVAYQVAANFYFLPLAIAATPVALSLLPRLARLDPAGAAFRDTFVRGLRFALFLSLPAAAVLFLSAPLLAGAVSFGEMADGGAPLVTLALMALAVGVLGEAGLLLGTYASYALGDTRAPLRSMLLKFVVCLSVLAIGTRVEGRLVVVVAGLAVSLSSLAGAAHRLRAVLRQLPRTDERIAATAVPGVLGVIGMAGPLWAGAHVVGPAPDGWRGVLQVVVVVAVGGAVYLATQRALGVREVVWLGEGIRRRATPMSGLP